MYSVNGQYRLKIILAIQNNGGIGSLVVQYKWICDKTSEKSKTGS